VKNENTVAGRASITTMRSRRESSICIGYPFRRRRRFEERREGAPGSLT
jgi:hypothetical protein